MKTQGTKQKLEVGLKTSLTLNHTIIASLSLALVISLSLVAYFVFQSKPSKAEQDESTLLEFKHKTVINIDDQKFKQDKDLIGFTIKIELDGEYLKHVSMGGSIYSSYAEDILFTKENGRTILPHKVEIYAAESGKLSINLLLDTIYHDRQNNVCLYYGNEDMASNIWNYYFKETKRRDTSFVMGIHKGTDADPG